MAFRKNTHDTILVVTGNENGKSYVYSIRPSVMVVEMPLSTSMCHSCQYHAPVRDELLKSGFAIIRDIPSEAVWSDSQRVQKVLFSSSDLSQNDPNTNLYVGNGNGGAPSVDESMGMTMPRATVSLEETTAATLETRLNYDTYTAKLSLSADNLDIGNEPNTHRLNVPTTHSPNDNKIGIFSYDHIYTYDNSSHAGEQASNIKMALTEQDPTGCDFWEYNKRPENSNQLSYDSDDLTPPPTNKSIRKYKNHMSVSTIDEPSRNKTPTKRRRTSKKSIPQCTFTEPSCSEVDFSTTEIPGKRRRTSPSWLKSGEYVI